MTIQISRVCRKSDRVETAERQVRGACDRAEGRRRAWKLASRGRFGPDLKLQQFGEGACIFGADRRRFLSHRVVQPQVGVGKTFSGRDREGGCCRSRVNKEHLGGKGDGRIRQLSSPIIGRRRVLLRRPARICLPGVFSNPQSDHVTAAESWSDTPGVAPRSWHPI